MTQPSDNPHALFEKDPAVAITKQLSSHITIAIIQVMRADTRTDSEKARKLKISTAAFKKLMLGDTSPFCLEDLFQLAVRAGMDVKSTAKKHKLTDQVAVAINITSAVN
jgi:hypothetical protein